MSLLSRRLRINAGKNIDKRGGENRKDTASPEKNKCYYAEPDKFSLDRNRERPGLELVREAGHGTRPQL